MSSAPDSTVGNWLAELQRLAARDPGPSLHEQLLRIAVRGLGASGGAVWFLGDAGRLRLETQLGLGEQPIDQLHEGWSGHAEMLRAVVETGRPQAQSASLNARTTGNGAERTVAQPLKVLAGPVYDAHARLNGVIELFLPADALAGPEQAALESLHEFCHRAAAIPRNIVPPARETTLDFDQFAQACRRLHGSLDVETTAVAVANEARAWIGCDRVSVFETRGRTCRLLAVSDQDAIDHRSRAVRSLQSLAESVVRRGEPEWGGGDKTRNSQLDSGDLDAQSAQTERRVAVMPMFRPDEKTIIGVLIAEDFAQSGAWSQDAQVRVALIASQGALAIGSAVSLRSLPLSRLGRLLQRMGWNSPLRSLPRWGLAVAACAGIAAWLTLYPAEFRITGRGELHPATQRDVFARVPAVVDAIHVSHGDPVPLNGPLITLRSPDMERERTRLEGELRTTAQQLTDLAILRAGTSREFDSQQAGSAQLAARELELTAVQDGLRDQLAALERFESELTLTSPLDGRVLTSNVAELLDGRPVEPGQRLLTVADVDGPWIVRIYVPDHDIRHVMDALEEPQPLRVSFVTATDVETQHAGHVTDVARVVEFDPLNGPVVLVTAAVERIEGLDLRPGATVYPRIDCGRRSIGYVWFRRLIDSTKSWLAF